ncbi:MAG: hypothetical protein IK120_04720, partial [Muribaculaceae bacterium]|nr:hypothetical protein [Muribaculaceae bacterium]
MTLKNLLVAIMVAGCMTANATTYLVSPSATSTGATITYKGQNYVVGTTAFADLAALVAASPQANSTVYVAPGTYGGATIATAGLNFKGANAFIDGRAQTRGSASTITGSIVVNANNVTLNGFDFSGNGKVYNTAATNTTPLSGFTFIYNVLNNSTIARTSSGSGSTGFLRLGKVYTDANANAETSQTRYKSVTISHNQLTGTTGPDFVILAGLYGTNNIVDNTFKDGAHGIHIANSRGTINILNNKFDGCGTNNINDATKKGDFALRIYRNAYAGTTVFNIKHNEFNNCSGQEGVYPCIRVFQGHSGDDDCVTPKNCSINLNYNAFRNKTKVHDTYNYLMYLDATECGAIKCDTRFNQVDNSGYQYAYVNSPSFSGRERYYLDNTGRIKPSQGTFGTWKSATSLGATTAMQSFDFDTETGDLYTIQLSGGSALQSDPKPLVITRVKSGATSATSTMKVCYGGHGTNMAVCRIDGKVYIFCGGKAELKDDGSETVSKYTAFFRYVGGATVNLTKDSFTYDGTTYPITYFKKGHNQYPSIDEGNRLFAYRTTGTNDAGTTISNFFVYDLDDVLTNGTNATLLQKVVVTKGEESTGNYGDNGYQTWDHQGWTINGDFIYIGEGVGTWTSTAYNGKSTTWIHVYNWRKNKFSYRYRFTDWLSLVPGELEGVKVRRDSNGHACMILGLVSGSSPCKAVFYKYTPPESAELPIKKGAATASVSSLAFAATSTSAVTKSVKLTNEYLNGEYTFTISGANAEQFAVTSITGNTVYSASTTVKVSYTPTDGITSSTGYLRCSSPYMTDIVIPLTGTYTPPSTDPTITASASSLSFTAEEESSVTKSVTFTGANLTGNISLALSGANASQFSLSASSLGTSGGSVTVTYSPAAAGSHSATLTASSSGAPSVTVALNGTATAKPIVDPTQFVFTKVLDSTSNIIASADGRFSTGYGDYVYVNDKANGKVVRYNSSGTRQDYATVDGLGTGITSDDAGNIVVNTNFASVPSSTSWVIIEPNGTQHSLTLTYPSGVTAARLDASGRILGNVMSSAGAYWCLIPSGASSGAVFHIVNGAQSGNATVVNPTFTADATAIAQPIVTELSAVVANPDASFAYRVRSGKNPVIKAISASTSDGFDVFTLGNTTYVVEPVGTNYSDGYAIHAVGSDDILAEKTQTLTSPGGQRFQSLTARVSDDGT